MKKVFVLAFLFAAIMFTGCFEKGGNEVLATVGGKKITRADLNKELDAMPPQYQMFASDPSVQRSIVEELITQQVIINYADKNGISAKKEVEAKIKQFVERINTEINAQLKMLNAQKAKAESIAKRRVLYDEVLNTVDHTKINVTDADIKEAYNGYVQMLSQRNPGAKPEPLEKIKDNLRKAAAEEKWAKELRAAEKVEINEKAFERQVPSAGLPPITIGGESNKK